MQKILLELTGKIKESSVPAKTAVADDALDALISLGLPRQKAKEALSGIPENADTEIKIKEALKILGRK